MTAELAVFLGAAVAGPVVWWWCFLRDTPERRRRRILRAFAKESERIEREAHIAYYRANRAAIKRAYREREARINEAAAGVRRGLRWWL